MKKLNIKKRKSRRNNLISKIKIKKIFFLNNSSEYNEKTKRTNYSTKAAEHRSNREKTINLYVNKASDNRRKRSLLTYKSKKNSIDKFISFFNDQD